MAFAALGAQLTAFAIDHWAALLAGAAALIAFAALYRFLATNFGPNDHTGNGIVVGRAKAFDNRTFSLIVEKLDASLRGLGVVNPNFASSPSAFQGETLSEVERGIAASGAVGAPAIPAPSASGKSADNGRGKSKEPSDDKSDDEAGAAGGATKKQAAGKASDGFPAFAPRFDLAAGDALADQISLANQVLNLRLLNERSLSDRLFGTEARFQVVLGFQISIDPPRAMRNCVAIAEIEITMADGTAPVSVVAMTPQEKTYNVASLSSRGDSLDGSIVTNALKIGGSLARRQKQLFLHRDSDTVAFERNPQRFSGAFGLTPAAIPARTTTILGWQFRPVLGRRSVTPGIRQMMAVVALPKVDAIPLETLRLNVRTYWRRYNRKHQTTSVRLGWWPLRLDGSWKIETPQYDLEALPTGAIQDRLGLKIKELSWTDGGDGAAIVLGVGQNFYSGSEISLAGKTYRAGEGAFILKSDRAFEFRTTIAALAKGDAVISGRYGQSQPMRARPPDRLPAPGINILSAKFSRVGSGETVRVSVLVTPSIHTADLTRAVIDALPRPILLIDEEPVPGPYDIDEERIGAAPAVGAADNRRHGIRIEAWTSVSKITGRVKVKVPFCGPDWMASSIFSIGAPTVTRIGGNVNQTLIISSEASLGNGWVAIVDRKYKLGCPEFRKLTDSRFALELPAALLQQFDKFVLRLGTSVSHLLDIPSGATAPEAAILDDSQPPPTIARGKAAVFDLKGENLSDVSQATLSGRPASFSAFADGTMLRVFVSARDTARSGEKRLELTTTDGSLLTIGIFVVEKPNSDE